MIVEIEIDRIAGFPGASVEAMVAVIVQLQGHIGAAGESVVPTSKDITGRYYDLVSERARRSVENSLHIMFWRSLAWRISPWKVIVSRRERSQSDRNPSWNMRRPSFASPPCGEDDLPTSKYLPNAR
jgi:hypothetical protein